jgi:hypothetical protein
MPQLPPSLIQLRRELLEKCRTMKVMVMAKIMVMATMMAMVMVVYSIDNNNENSDGDGDDANNAKEQLHLVSGSQPVCVLALELVNPLAKRTPLRVHFTRLATATKGRCDGGVTGGVMVVSDGWVAWGDGWALEKREIYFATILFLPIPPPYMFTIAITPPSS